jgi:phosphoenolpyruvate---glycerone phosphotransferase subunit DhaM
MAYSNGKVRIVLVSHSRELAHGLADLIREVAGPDLVVTPSGGGETGDLGTDGSRVLGALREAAKPPGAVVLMDIGSSVLTVRAAFADLSSGEQEWIRVVDAPLVEGGVAAGVAASTGASIADVVRAAEDANYAKTL